MSFGQKYPQFYQPHPGATLEHVVLSNSKQFYKPTAAAVAAQQWKSRVNKESSSNMEMENLIEEDDSNSNCCNKKWCWWSPNQDSIAVSFCTESSIHGLRFMGQLKRHITERAFWLIAFCLSLAAALYLIYGVWDRQNRIPVIVSFQAKEQDIDSLPFPAVTLCNMNKFPKSKVLELQRIAGNPSHKNQALAKQQLAFVRSACNAQHSFAKSFHYAYTRGTKNHDGDNDTISEDSQDDLVDFLLENTLDCGEFIRLCTFGETVQNCSEIFKPIITDYGKCCTFNIMPLPLLLKNPQNEGKLNASPFDNPVLGTKRRWNESELDDWRKWDYNEGFVLPKHITRPYRQKRAGMPYGMSVLVDPNIEDYYCPVSDSMGIRFILHTPLEMPHVMEFASVADLDKEILIEVHPDVTNADNDIKDFEREKRQCYFGNEKSLRFFGPYTGGNCIDECTAVVLGQKCNCTYFFMPRDDGVRICNNDLDSMDHECIEKARIDLQATLAQICGHCDQLCEDIAYNYETTIVELQDSKQLWDDPDPEYHPDGVPKWAKHKMSVVHIFFGSETTVPKLRKRLYGTTDLIANTGGILGLCLGFSVLSAVEVVYFVTIRAFWKYCRRRMVGRKVADKFTKMFKTNREKVINVNPNRIPIYPSNQFYNNNLQQSNMQQIMYTQTPYGGNVGYY